MNKGCFARNAYSTRRYLLMSSASFVLALATLSPALAQVTIGGDSTPSDSTLIDGSVDLEIGVSGPGMGSLDILNGATLTNATGYVGVDVSGVGIVTVSGQGSRWDNLGDVVIGQSGQGTLDILGGGFVSADTGYVGASADGTGIVTISGDDGAGNTSTWSLQRLVVGDEGTATLNVGQGGHVTTTGRIGVGSTGEWLRCGFR